jgi:hypothetical protein
MSANSSGIVRIPPVRWAVNHPRIAAWIVLSVGMIILLAIEAREVGLLPTQWLALFIACILVAGACVWIISWEGDDEEEDAIDGDPVKTVAPPVSTVEVVTPPSETPKP